VQLRFGETTAPVYYGNGPAAVIGEEIRRIAAGTGTLALAAPIMAASLVFTGEQFMAVAAKKKYSDVLQGIVGRKQPHRSQSGRASK
jgi:hypothetical protein